MSPNETLAHLLHAMRHGDKLVETLLHGGAVLGRLSPVATAFLHNGTTIGILLRALSSSGAPRNHRTKRLTAAVSGLKPPQGRVQ